MLRVLHVVAIDLYVGNTICSMADVILESEGSRSGDRPHEDGNCTEEVQPHN